MRLNDRIKRLETKTGTNKKPVVITISRTIVDHDGAKRDGGVRAYVFGAKSKQEEDELKRNAITKLEAQRQGKQKS